MSWTLALSVASGGIGTARLGAAGSPESIGFFPDVDRAFAFASEGEATRVPDAVLLVVPTTLSSQNLKWYMGEVVIAVVPTDKVRVRTVPEVLTSVYGGQVIFADASWKELTTTVGDSEELKVARLNEITAECPEATVFLAGHPGEREKFTTEAAPVLLDYPQIATLALEDPTAGASIAQSAPEVSVEPAPAASKSKLVSVIIVLAIAAVIILALSFLV